jgi:hypothetical protein
VVYVVAKQASARYTPEATSWVNIKNRQHSQAVGREDFFDRRRTAGSSIRPTPHPTVRKIFAPSGGIAREVGTVGHPLGP